MASPGYQSCTFEERGVLDTIKNLAGQTNNNGSVRVGLGPPMTVKMLAEHLGSLVPGADSRELQKQIKKLITVRLLSVTRSGVVRPATWREDQLVSSETQRKREYRERLRTADPAREAVDDVSRVDASRSAPPSPPPQASGSASGLSGRDSPGTVPIESRRQKTEAEEDADASLNQGSESGPELLTTSGSEQDGGGEGGAERIWIDSPITVALQLCEERGTFPTNSWKKKLRTLTETFNGDHDRAVATFRDCLQILSGMIRERRIKTTRAQTLHGLLNKRIQGDHRP